MEEYTPENQQVEEESGEFKRWFQDNLRIIISVVIVVLIAGGIYSYSKRSDSPLVGDNSASIEKVDEQSQVDITGTDSQTKPESTNASETKKVAPTSSSQETESAFVETAGRSDSLTTLARHATADYLEKNPDSSLTKEHKIYIEDYLRKNVGSKGHVRVGTSVEFSKDLVKQAIEQSKKLSSGQLKNLEKYSARVASL
jgi:hypothetical protein